MRTLHSTQLVWQRGPNGTGAAMAEEGSDDPEWVVATQQGLGSLIKRPKLTTPLLMKPPFRFLHDVVSEVMRTCGFAEGLYDENETQSSKIKDKESKLAYLNKISSVVELTLGITLEMRPAKVVAGMEPEKTNQFLQVRVRVRVRVRARVRVS